MTIGVAKADHVLIKKADRQDVELADLHDEGKHELGHVGKGDRE